MKAASRFLIVLLLMTWLSACTNTNSNREGIWEGIYNFFNQEQRMRNSEAVLPVGEEPPTYEQYERERQKELTGQNDSLSQ